jgi:MOSC domain-containing protein YiiM
MSDRVEHALLAQLEEGFFALPEPPKDRGRLMLIVRKTGVGQREVLEQARLTPDEGLTGDEWARRLPAKPEAQLAVMRMDVAELIAHGQPVPTFGDNLYVDLDISAANLPAGTRIRVGEALVEVTPMPHNGCKKFNARFGSDALRFVSNPATRPQNFRGIYWRVIEPGEVRAGSEVRVVSRGSPDF